MIYINVKDMEFLVGLEGELGAEEGWTPRVTALWELNERLKKQKEKTNESQKKLMRKRRS